MLDNTKTKPRARRAASKVKTVIHPYAAFVSGELLNLSRQNLVDKDVLEVLRFIQNNPHINKLDLSLNHIGDQGIADFAERNHAIYQADFSGNNISDIGLAVFAYKNQAVVRVNFSHNRISDTGIVHFAEQNHNCYFSQFSPIRYH